jgi:hypothetical protein
VTVVSVAPGDTLTFVDKPAPAQIVSQPIDVTMPATTWDAAASSDTVYVGGCFAAVGSTLTVTTGCAHNGAFPILGLANDLSGNEIDYTYQTGNALSDAGLDDAGATMTLPYTVARAWSPTNTVTTVSATDAITLTPDAGLLINPMDLGFTEVSGSVPRSRFLYNPVVDAGVGSAVFPQHVGYPDYVEGNGSVTVSNGTGMVTEIYGVVRADPQATAQSLALALETVPAIIASSTDTSGDGGVAAPVFSWKTTGFARVDERHRRQCGLVGLPAGRRRRDGRGVDDHRPADRDLRAGPHAAGRRRGVRAALVRGLQRPAHGRHPVLAHPGLRRVPRPGARVPDLERRVAADPADAARERHALRHGPLPEPQLTAARLER